MLVLVPCVATLAAIREVQTVPTAEKERRGIVAAFMALDLNLKLRDVQVAHFPYVLLESSAEGGRKGSEEGVNILNLGQIEKGAPKEAVGVPLLYVINASFEVVLDKGLAGIEAV